MLAFLTLEMGVGIGKEIHTVIADDDPDLAACVAWQARVTGGIDVAGAYALAHPEQGPHCWIVGRGDSPAEPAVRRGEGQRWIGLR